MAPKATLLDMLGLFLSHTMYFLNLDCTRVLLVPLLDRFLQMFQKFFSTPVSGFLSSQYTILWTICSGTTICPVKVTAQSCESNFAPKA